MTDVQKPLSEAGISPEQRPDFFAVAYHGNDVGEGMLFTRLSSGGYVYRCPSGKHRGLNWLDTDSGERHTLTMVGRNATVKGSLLCPQGCGWHTVIENGVMRDV